MKISYLKLTYLVSTAFVMVACQPNSSHSNTEASEQTIETSEKITSFKKSNTPSLSPNPYAAFLRKKVSELSAPDRIPETTRGRPVIEAARDVELRAWAATDPRSELDEKTRQRLLSESIQLIDALTAIANASPTGGKGGPNMDRFFLAPLFEAILHLRNGQAISEEKLGQWLSSSQLALENQYEEYGRTTAANWDTRLAGGYPNMDAAYVLIMGIAAELYGEPRFKDSAEKFVDYLTENTLSGGSVRYIGSNRGDGMQFNASPVYTGVVILYLARYLSLTDSKNTRTLLESLEAHYPKAWVFPGIPENSSAPWWKHTNYTNRLAYAGVFDIIASVAQSPANRAYAQQLIAMGRIDVADALAAVDFYDPEIPIKSPSKQQVVIDPDIGGFRGVFGDFSWVGSLGPTQDTLIGAMAVTPLLENGELSGFDYHSLMLVTPEVGLGSKKVPGKPLYQHAAFATDQEYSGASFIATDQPIAVLGASYQLRQPGIYKPEHPASNWRSDQAWIFLPDRILGIATMHYAGTRSEDSSYARTRIRTEHRGDLRPMKKEGSYKNGPLQIEILETSFDKRRHGLAEITDHLTGPPNADEIFLEESPKNRLDQHLTAIEIRYGRTLAATGFQRLKHSTLIGFTFTIGTETYEVFYNPSSDSVKLHNTEHEIIYLGTERAMTAGPLTTDIVVIPPQGVACLLR